jgi:RND superfamily putative drug exporter
VESFARTVMRHRRIVSGVWLVLFVLGGWSASQLGDRLTFDFSLPGQPGDTAEQQLIESYGVSTFDTYIAVLSVPEGQTVSDRQGDVAGVYEGR